MRVAGGDVARSAAAVARLQAPAQFAGEEVGRGVAVADLQDDDAPLAGAALQPALQGRRDVAVVLGFGKPGGRSVWPRFKRRQLRFVWGELSPGAGQHSTAGHGPQSGDHGRTTGGRNLQRRGRFDAHRRYGRRADAVFRFFLFGKQRLADTFQYRLTPEEGRNVVPTEIEAASAGGADQQDGRHAEKPADPHPPQSPSTCASVAQLGAPAEESCGHFRQ